MPLMKLDNVSIAFGIKPVLDRVNLQIDEQERIGLIGRNGEGKSTLMKLLASQILPDSGEVWKQAGVVVATLDQTPNLPLDSTVFEAVADSLGEVGHLISRYHDLLLDLGDRLDELGRLQHQIETLNGWSLQQKVESILTRLNLPAEKVISELSGGWQRRVGLACALVVSPDILLLDEPTNHLDIETIVWLEKQLESFQGTVICITHDRAFLQNISKRIIELDRGNLTSWSCDYQKYLVLKAAALDAEEKQNSEFDKKLAQEEVWIRQGIKARRTRNEGRVRALEKMRGERAQRRNISGGAKLDVDRGELSGKLVIDAENIFLSYEDKTLIKDFSCRLMRGDRVGLVGPNGIGKSTLIKSLLKQIDIDAGEVKHGTKLQIAYFDQHRTELDTAKTVIDIVAEGRQSITINGRDRHIISYLGDFLFSPERARSPVSVLSGGERNRIMLAKLFSKPTNFMIMDEPTNDLDVETLELLEELLLSYKGTLLLVSHDRTFLENVATSYWLFEGEGGITEFVGEVPNWGMPLKQKKVTAVKANNEPAPVVVPEVKKLAKLSYKLQQELNKIPKQIETLETELESLQVLTGAAEFHEQDRATVQEKLDELATVDKQLQDKYLRWDELESMRD